MNPLYRNDRAGEYPDSWYTATADLPPPNPPLLGATRADVCILGAGFTGLVAAIELAGRGYDVVVLEAHRPGFGASGRNGGQMGSGYNWSQTQLEAEFGRGNARLLWDLAEEARSLVRSLAAAHAPNARLRDGVAHGAWSAPEARALRSEAEHLRRAYGYRQIESLTTDAFEGIIRSPRYRGGIIDRGAAHLHPLRHVAGLVRAARALGVRFHDRTEVTGIAHGDRVTVRTPAGRVDAGFLVIAGNGYLPTLDRRLAARVMPINSFIGATEPLGDLAHDVLTQDIACADSKFVVNYFRLTEDRRLLFGGREAYTIGFPRDISTRLHARMTHLFPQLQGIRFSHVWGGTLGITLSRLPLATALAPNVFAAAGFSGHGVALTHIAGRLMAEAVAGQAERFETFAALAPRPFPGGASLRAPLLTLAMSWYGLRDRLGV